MGTHASGDGAAWDNLEALDVDQPHGLDYRESVHMAKAVRKRLSQEHELFADATVGGKHTPGGAGILMVDSTADMDTFAAAADLTSAHAFGVACNPAADPTGATLFYFSDATVTTTLPVSWNNILTEITHSFGARSEITVGVPVIFDQSTGFTGDAGFTNLGVGGEFSVDGTADFAGDVAFEADISVDGTADFGGDVAVVGDLSVDGALAVGGDVSVVGNIGGLLFSSWCTVATLSNDSSGGTDVASIQAGEDGILTAYVSADTSDGGSGFFAVKLLTDAANPPTTIMAATPSIGESAGWAQNRYGSASTPVKKGDYYMADMTIADGTSYGDVAIRNYYWMPLGK